jgi:L-ribulose-5-phosphate 3-epimerase
MHLSRNRRQFLHVAVATVAAPGFALAFDKKDARLKKAVKFGMIGIKAPIREKFELIKSLGFQGVEMDSPSGIDKDEAVRAVRDTGIVIHGVIDSVHWNDTLSDPKDEVRARGVAALKTALEDAKVYGATTVLLVPGVVKKDVSYQQCWDRSQAEVRKALPLAEKVGVKIAIECVWNNFITKPEQMVQYVDSFQSPYVGSYFDCSNMVKFGVKSGDWIRALGKRMLKFDFKGYSKKKGWVDIGEGDEDWPDIVKALEEVDYHGWATAEVAGGGRKELEDVANRMNKILGLS